MPQLLNSSRGTRVEREGHSTKSFVFSGNRCKTFIIIDILYSCPLHSKLGQILFFDDWEGFLEESGSEFMGNFTLNNIGSEGLSFSRRGKVDGVEIDRDGTTVFG